MIEGAVPVTTVVQASAVTDATALVERARAGDHAAFERLASDAFPRLWDVARRVLADPALAEDAVQECLLRAWRDLRALRDPNRFEGWLFRLLARACTDEWRRSRRRVVQVPVLPLDAIGDVGPDIDVERRDQLQRAFTRLNPDQRLVLVLHHYLGLRPGEIADGLGIPEGTVTSRIHYGTRLLRGALDADLRPTRREPAR
jgi:RNA polymerase sigma-70 factor (ECF subfamily)